MLLACVLLAYIVVGFVGAVPVLAATPNPGLEQSFQCNGDPQSCVCPPADATCGKDKAAGCTNTDCDLIAKYVNPFIKFLSIVAGMAVTIGIIYGGIQYAASGGDPQKTATAKTHIKNSVIALLVFFFLYAILRFLVPGGALLVG